MVSSGEYSADEWSKERKQYAKMIQEISEKGILALHLSYGKNPFQEHYFPVLGRWLQKNRVVLTDDNYFPFYFVYAAFTGPRRGELLKGRHVLVVNGARGKKRKKIEHNMEWTLKDSWEVFAKYFCIIDKEQLDLLWPKYNRLEYRWLRYDKKGVLSQELSFREWLNVYSGNVPEKFEEDFLVKRPEK